MAAGVGIRVGYVCTTCTQPALKHDMSIQTLHNAQLPIPYPLFSLLNNTARGIHCLGVHTRGRAEGLVHPGVEDPWIFHVAKCASSAGPDLGSFSFHRCSFSLPPLFLITPSTSSTNFMRWFPCVNYAHVGTPHFRAVGPPLGARIWTTRSRLCAPALPCCCRGWLIRAVGPPSGARMKPVDRCFVRPALPCRCGASSTE